MEKRKRIAFKEEWFDPTHAQLGPQNALLTTLAMVGVAGETSTAPLLPSR